MTIFSNSLMRIFLKLLIIILLITGSDAAHATDPTKVVVQADSGKAALTTVNNIVNPPAAAGTAAGTTPCTCREKDLLPFQKGLVVLPVVLAVLFFLLVFRVLKRAGYKLADALSENDTMTTTVPAPANPLNPPGQAANNAPNVLVLAASNTPQTQTMQTGPGNRSASRLVLFLSGFTAIIIAVCITTYYLYYYLYCGQAPDLDGLTSIILTLGIGVIPYAVNKATQ
ncbi:MAG: hypothetical protein AVDCRST_MAG56-7842 [uncultured Cytophagales bacterium]|uniref:Transmembrane protein n=1 Tax=uncultured Cytophagales bacterium TaxID=158755 RepID=A0A6J4LTI3_9SPHI|nr:MAG: hypothetical protein AVDCRST_MAG56-7842 [uncultured Cytophagales bacterium]